MNTRINIGYSVSSLQNVPKDLFKKIQNNISFYDASKFHIHKKFKKKKDFNWSKARTNLMDYNGQFPTGLTKRVFIECQKLGLNPIILDQRVKPKTNYLKLKTNIEEPTAYIDQKLSSKSLIESPSGRGIIVLPTGVGKSRVMKDTIQQLGINTLIVVPSLHLKFQIFLYLSQCFGDLFVGYFDKNGNNKPISIANLDSLSKCDPEIFKFFDCVYFDEWHHEACETARDIDTNMFDSIYYKFAQTATNFRNSKNEQILLDCIMANQTYNLSVIDAIKKKYIVPIQPIFHEVGDIERPDKFKPKIYPFCEESNDEEWDKYKDSLHYKDIYPQWIAYNDERNEKLAKSAFLMAHKNKIPILILVKRIEHGEFFKNSLNGVTFVHGKLGQKNNHAAVDAFNRGEIPILCGTEVIGEGVDTKEAGAIILGSGEKAKTRVMQNTGRVVRRGSRFPKDIGFIVDVFDNGHKTTKKHSNIRKRIYQNEFGVKIKRL